jgi:hypothetical protein
LLYFEVPKTMTTAVEAHHAALRAGVTMQTAAGPPAETRFIKTRRHRQHRTGRKGKKLVWHHWHKNSSLYF